MTLSTAIGIGVGLALVYYLLGLIVSVITETVKNIFDMRAQALEGVLEKLLATRGDVLFDRFRQSTFIRTLEPVAPRFLQIQNRVNRKVSDIPDATFSLAIVEALASEKLVFDGVRLAITELIKTIDMDESVRGILTGVVDDLSDEQLVEGIEVAAEKIPDKAIQQKLQDLLGLLKKTPEEQIECVLRGIESLPDGGVKDALRGLVDLKAENVDDFRKRLETWYDDMVANFRDLFKRNMRAVVIWVSLAVTLIVGPDTIQIAQFLWEQPAHRESAVAVAPALIQEYGESVSDSEEMAGLSAEEKIERFEEHAGSVMDIVRDLEALDIPLPWWRVLFPDVADWTFLDWVLGFALKLLGLLLTWGATSQGAPFWYDILKKLNPSSSPKEKTS